MTGIYTMKQSKRAKERSPVKVYKYFKYQKGIFEVYLTDEPLLTSHWVATEVLNHFQTNVLLNLLTWSVTQHLTVTGTSVTAIQTLLLSRSFKMSLTEALSGFSLNSRPQSCHCGVAETNPVTWEQRRCCASAISTRTTAVVLSTGESHHRSAQQRGTTRNRVLQKLCRKGFTQNTAHSLPRENQSKGPCSGDSLGCALSHGSPAEDPLQLPGLTYTQQGRAFVECIPKQQESQQSWPPGKRDRLSRKQNAVAKALPR